MAGRGPAPKPAERRQRRNKTEPALSIVRVVPAHAPTLGAKVKAPVRQAWSDLWADPISSAFVPSDIPALRRLFTLYDERARAFEGYQKDRLVPGSTGQAVLNPLFKVVQACDAEIRQLEDRFGLSPTARTRLGIAMGEAKKTLDDLNQSLQADSEEEVTDPRA